MSPSQQPESSKPGDDSRRIGRWMIVATWLLLLILLTLLFSDWLQRERNPNRALTVVDGPAGEAVVTLQSNRAGHYLASGEINGVEVTFLLDTGATRVAVPEQVARRAGLRKGPRSQSVTAGGVTDTWLTRIDSVRLGPFEMRGVHAAIIPDMPGDEVLLGMNFLRHFKLEQEGEQMRITPLE